MGETGDGFIQSNILTLIDDPREIKKWVEFCEASFSTRNSFAALDWCRSDTDPLNPTDATSPHPVDAILERRAAKPKQLKPWNHKITGVLQAWVQELLIMRQQQWIKQEPDVTCNSLIWGCFHTYYSVFFFTSTVGEYMRYWKALSFLRIEWD